VFAKGHLEIMKWLATGVLGTSLKTTNPEDPTVVAAMNGQLEVLKWLKEQHYSWNEMVCYGAACNSHLEVLKWVLENGCEWDRSHPLQHHQMTLRSSNSAKTCTMRILPG